MLQNQNYFFFCIFKNLFHWYTSPLPPKQQQTKNKNKNMYVTCEYYYYYSYSISITSAVTNCNVLVSVNCYW